MLREKLIVSYDFLLFVIDRVIYRFFCFLEATENDGDRHSWWRAYIYRPEFV
jgi:hypothetical protein